MHRIVHYLSFLILFLLWSSTVAFSQSGDKMFDNSILHEIKIEFSDSDFWNELLTNYDDTEEGAKVPYMLANITIDGELIDSVGIRLKGFTSYRASEIKKPFKIDFNEYVKGQKYDGLRKLNLNNGTADPSMQRDVVCYDMLRNLGVKASRTSFSKVYINDEYWGLYQNIEQVDKVFLKNNFDNPKGNLYKNKGWDTLQWRGNEAFNYYPPYELKTNKTENDWSGFVNFVDVINNASDEEFPSAIKKIFDVDVFLKTLAVDVASNNWDSYLEHGRNWYIYEDKESGIFTWIPWDYNLSFGANLGFGSYDDCFVFANFGFESIDSLNVSFTNRSFFLEDYASYKWNFGDDNESTQNNPKHKYEEPGKYFVCLTTTLNDTCSSEVCKWIDTKFKIENCPSILDGSCPHPANNIFKQVLDFAPNCCDEWGENCEEIYQWLYDPYEGGGFNGIFTIDQTDNEKILIKRLLAEPTFTNKYYGYVCELMDNYLTENRLFELMDHNQILIDAAIKEDKNFLYSYEDFQTDIGIIDDEENFKHKISNRIVALKTELEELVNCNTVSVDDRIENIDFRIFPNPTQNTVFINIGDTSNANYQVNIHTATGQLIYQDKNKSTQRRLDVSAWNNGLYIVTVVDFQGRIGRNKFVVSH